MTTTTRVLVIIASVLLAVSAWLYHSWDKVAVKLAVSQATVASQEATITKLEKSLSITDQILGDRKKSGVTLTEIRAAMRAEIKEALRNESFKAWYAAPAPADAWRLLRETAARTGRGPAPGRADPAGTGP